MGEETQLKQRENSRKISKSLEMSIRGNEVITNTAVWVQEHSKRNQKGLESNTKVWWMKEWTNNLNIRLQGSSHKLNPSNEKWRESDVTPSLSCPPFSALGLWFWEHRALTPNWLLQLCVVQIRYHLGTCVLHKRITAGEKDEASAQMSAVNVN